jgi:hypothetical protein
VPSFHILPSPFCEAGVNADTATENRVLTARHCAIITAVNSVF